MHLSQIPHLALHISYIHELEQEVVALRTQLDGYRRNDAPAMISSSSAVHDLGHQDPALLEDAQMLTNLATAAASHHAMHHQPPPTQPQEYHYPPSVSPGSLHQLPRSYPLPPMYSGLPVGMQPGKAFSRSPLVHSPDYSHARYQGDASRTGFGKDKPYSTGHNHARSGSVAQSRTVAASDNQLYMDQEDFVDNSTARDMVDSVVSDIAFGGAVAASDLPRPVGHFMGASSGVSLARMVVDAVLRTGPAAGSPLPERRDSALEPAMSRPNASPAAAHAISHPYESSKRAAFSLRSNGADLQNTSSPLGGSTIDPPSSATSTIDPALSSYNMTRTDYPTSHSRLPAHTIQHPIAPVSAGEGSTESPYTSNQRSTLDSPSPDISHRHPNPVAASPVPPISIPALPPAAAVDRLVQVYVDFVQIMLPILHMPTFEKQLGRVREKSSDVQESDIFFVLMVLGQSMQWSITLLGNGLIWFEFAKILALSTMALSRSLDPKAELRMSSEAFYVEASKHLEAVFEDRTYIGLQAILLCCYYSLLNPTRGSIWHLVGLASRCAVDHGFHHETDAATTLSPIEIDMRRRLFHAVYNLDRLLCHSLGRPHSIPDDFISVPLFSSLPDYAITEHGLLPAEPDPYKVVALNFIPLRELQSEINSRLYSVKAAEAPSQEWFDKMFERLKIWLSNSPEPKGCTSAEGYAISFHSNIGTVAPAISSRTRDEFPSVAGLGSAGAHAESAMRHSFQSQGLPSPLPKLELPTELNMLDNLFLNPLAPHPKASESTMVKTGYSKGAYLGQGEGSAPSSVEEQTGTSSAAVPTLGLSYAAGGDTAQEQQGAAFQELGPAGVGFDFLSFLAADDGGREANAQWLSTESYRQDMPMLG
ncbi:hypothetical protein QFC19_006313 [Naganishia cerealis]|uniref:Uncharacterized protein n=1 Tax=Naganishia cerealis TaxID=610337 RepID=A0ACC2VGM3_9TREE|nr:hypothetical protein QFC19_006313 [Naganishia cerealis]